MMNASLRDKHLLDDDWSQIKVHFTDDLKIFMSLLCDKHSVEMGIAIRSSIEVFNYCIPSRPAVLTFYSELFNEYSTYYWILKKRSLTTTTTEANSETNKNRIEYVGELTRRFYEMAKLKLADIREDQQSDFDICSGYPQPSTSRVRSSPSKSASSIAGPASPTASQGCSSPTAAPKIIPIGPRVIPGSRRTSSCNSNDMATDQTPMSPSAHDDNLENGIQYESDINAVDIFPELEELIKEIRSCLDNLVSKYKLRDKNLDFNGKSSLDRQRNRLRSVLINWASELLIQLNIKHCEIALLLATESSKSNPSNLLSTEIELWLNNPINKLLVDLLLESHEDIQSLFKRLIDSTKGCDWLLAHLLLEMSKRPHYDKDFSSCMEFIIGCQSTVKSVNHILAYLSDTNPKAMANFPKSNIPFLISLCQTSTSLLNVLCQEIPDAIDPDFVNNLAKEAKTRMDNMTQSPYISSLTHCIIAAPNSYKLFLLSLEVELDDRINQEAKSAAQLINNSISSRIHERAIHCMRGQQSMIHNLGATLIDNLLEQIKNDLPKLIKKCASSKFIEKKAMEIFHRMSLIYGNTFASLVICHYLNLPHSSFWPLLKPLLKKFMKYFGDDGSTLVSQTLSLDPSLRTPAYWQNIYSLTMLLPELKLNLDLICQLLINKLCAATIDIASTGQLIKLCCNSLERVNHNKICISTKHNLCKALATSYFLLLEYDGDNFPEVLSYIRISLTCMSLLKQSNVASHILCRALLERSLAYGHLFNKKFNQDSLVNESGNFGDWSQDDNIKLSKENLKVTLGHRFRRLPNQVPERFGKTKDIEQNESNHTDIPDKQSINCYLIIEAFKSSINNIEAFASLFVEFHCPIMFEKQLWPNDDSLRVINERNLSILRKFEEIPPFWDLYELIGEARCLKSCLVLVKALLAAHLALWASATVKSSPNRMISTLRLIPPLSQSSLIPKAFGLTVEVFPHLEPNEVFSVLSDIWQYLKDTNMNGYTDAELSDEEKKMRDKTYLDRLRLFMCQHIPGQLYVKIFKEFYKPTIST